MCDAPPPPFTWKRRPDDDVREAQSEANKRSALAAPYWTRPRAKSRAPYLRAGSY